MRRHRRRSRAHRRAGRHGGEDRNREGGHHPARLHRRNRTSAPRGWAAGHRQGRRGCGLPDHGCRRELFLASGIARPRRADLPAGRAPQRSPSATAPPGPASDRERRHRRGLRRHPEGTRPADRQRSYRKGAGQRIVAWTDGGAEPPPRRGRRRRPQPRCGAVPEGELNGLPFLQQCVPDSRLIGRQRPDRSSSGAGPHRSPCGGRPGQPPTGDEAAGDSDGLPGSRRRDRSGRRSGGSAGKNDGGSG